jgi:argininosuccinate lyase
MTRLWDKGLPLSERVLRYTAGEDHLLDARLVPYDVRGSIAHAEMLAATGLISDEDCNAIRGGLKQLEGSFEAGDWSITLQDEDVHTALESRLTRAIGDAGARLHLGRSRNDQVLTALRLYLLEAADDLVTRIDALRKSVAKLTERQGDIPLPGYTHMQQAMPSSVTLWCGGSAAGSRDDHGVARIRGDTNSGDGRPAVARQGGERPAVRDHVAAAGRGTHGSRPAHFLHAGIRLRGAGCRRDHGLVPVSTSR